MKQNFVVVLRSARERTVQVCENIIANELCEETRCVTIQCFPFEEAIRKSFEIGIQSGKKWLVTVDADVLISKGAFNKLVNYGSKLSSNVFQFEGFLYDALLLKYRKGGIKVYNTELLKKAISLIPKPGKELRPETFTQLKMQELGFNREKINIVSGIHDFEQYYSDVYRKAFVHANKHSEMMPFLMEKWSKLSKRDSYYYVALLGAKDGLMNSDQISLDVNWFETRCRLAFKRYDISEIGKLHCDDLDENYVDHVLKKAGGIKLNNYKFRIDRYHFENGTIKTIGAAFKKPVKIMLNW